MSDEVDRTMPREKYEELVRQMRTNMQGSIDGRRKYTFEMVDEKETTDDVQQGPPADQS